ncbi:MAG: class I SAM-dependent methyltransferase [Verrucomicrobia bacterium]|nr:class I SAM-dependent methyltransferase [Verrucomicrobiota bacterium]MCH8527692.1 class I SAM-dependent methyltransferase [Kiritimatiellia bacterium]
MKTRESGMPEEAVWSRFFDPEAIFDALQLGADTGDTVDFGCGYGTFALPAARRICGTVIGFDIEAEMIGISRQRARDASLPNVRFEQRDFVAEGSGLADRSVDYVMHFNILHAEERMRLLREARRILAPGGRVGIIHWNHDPKTPRGPSMEIRPRPGDCHRWVIEAGFTVTDPIVNLPPYHYGLVGRK